MDHFKGITPEERYKNELLREIKKLNENIEKLNDEKPVRKTKKVS